MFATLTNMGNLRNLHTGALLIVILVTEGAASASQSLGEVARREEERRKQVAAGRVYSNDALADVETTVAAPRQTPQATGSADQAGVSESTDATAQESGEEAAGSKPSERKQRDEKYWRNHMSVLRAAVAKANADLAAQEARLREIQNDSSPTAVREREVITRTIARLQVTARVHRDVLTRNLTQAELSGVAADWLR